MSALDQAASPRVGAPGSSRTAFDVAVYDGMDELPADVKAFLLAYSSDELCLDDGWFALLQQHSLPAGHSPRIYVVRSGAMGTVDCVMPAMSGDPRRHIRELMSMTSFYTMSYAPLMRKELEDAAAPLDALAAHIVRERPKWDVINLRSFIEEHPITGRVIKAFRRAGLLVDTYAQFENWYFPTNGISAEAYFKSRPSQVRNTITRKMKKVRKEHDIDFRLYQAPENLADGVGDYEKIYASSWKQPEAYPQFIPELLRRSAARGNLRLGVLRVDGDPAAAQIWLISGKKATIYKLAYDEKYAVLSVGSILTKMMFDSVLDNDRVAEVDYGIGSERYKLDWMSERRHIVGLICFNPFSLLGLGSAARHYAGRYWRGRVRKSGDRNPGKEASAPPAHAEGTAS